MSDPYKVLGIDRDAPQGEIRKAYFQLVREHPPETDPEGFKQIREAYERLKSEDVRRETDRFLFYAPPREWAASTKEEEEILARLMEIAEEPLVRGWLFSDLQRIDFREDFQKV